MFYSDNAGPSDFQGDVWRLNGTKGYLRHYSNYLTLSFLAKATKDRRERQTLEKELLICQRKLDWWRRHPNYVDADVQRGIEALKKDWKISTNRYFAT